MSTLILRKLQPQFRGKLSEEFLKGAIALDVTAFEENADPAECDLTPLVNTVETAMRKFSASDKVASDQWLAPRVHAALRLTRRQASEYGIWEWLAVSLLEGYVRWRWAKNDGNVVAERFSTSDMNRQAIARLWWGAELTRNGSDYSATPILFHTQDLQNVWSVARFFRNRPVAIAALRFLQTFNDGEFASGAQIKTLGKGFNSILTTTVLDAVAASTPVDVFAVADWQMDEESCDETKWDSDLPEGPPENKCDESDIQSVQELLDHVVRVTKFEST